ncbi:MAG: hypothetical protein JSS02_23250 [Planctomycetes bacterium]|nr:hypothetical protein [Planctomycetota bacterium]
MFELPRSSQLLRRVAFRLRMASIGSRLYVTFLACCGLYAAFLLASRLAGLWSEWVEPTTLVAIPLVALLVSVLWHKRPTPVDAARAVDSRQGTKDLFLTVALIEKTAGAYQPLVADAAEKCAEKVQPVAIIPFQWSRRLVRAGFVSALVLAAVLWLPQFDPFGKVQAAKQVNERKKELVESAKATDAKLAMLQKEETEGPLSEDTKKAIENLKTALNKMKPEEKADNLKELVGQQKFLGDKWKKLSSEKLKQLLTQAQQGQQFGSQNKDKLEKWTKELQEGSTKALQQELEEIKKDLEQLAKTDDPAKKADLEKQIKKRMKELSDFASEKVNSKPLTAALQRAMKQMEMSRMEGMDQEALEAAEKSLDLTKMELKEIAQSAKDLKALEEALKVAQMAKQLNDAEKLDGEAEGATTMEEYAEFYEQLLADLGMSGSQDGEGDGEGTGGEGMGEGGKVPEDDSIATDFKPEQSKSPVTAGKVLLSVKTKGLSDKGDASKQYKSAIQAVKQGYSEAILQEQVPPGYHDGIKSYFDNFEKTGKKDSKSAAPVKNESPDNK